MQTIGLNSVGNIVWERTFGGNDDDLLQSIQQTSDSGYIVGGYTTGAHKITSNYVVDKLNKLGRLQWEKVIGGSENDELYRIKEISKNHYVLGGQSASGISGDKTDTSRGLIDYWIVYLNYRKESLKMESISGLQNMNLHNNFSVYPIPAKDVLHVMTNGKTVITLTDLSGKILVTKTISGSETINVAGFAPGVYYLKNNATGSSRKVIVIK